MFARSVSKSFWPTQDYIPSFVTINTNSKKPMIPKNPLLKPVKASASSLDIMRTAASRASLILQSKN